MSTSPLIRLHPNDNVLVAKTPLALGDLLPEVGARLRGQGPAGHKVAASAIASTSAGVTSGISPGSVSMASMPRCRQVCTPNATAWL